MNEIRHIHLGRQPFTISVEAHQALKTYLAEIQKQVGDEDVAREVELRMSELLAERGVTGEKVILPEDVDFLKQQLGDPADFSDDIEAASTVTTADEPATKRLFRDTDNAMIAGVAAGIAAYFGLDVVLVRILFVLLAIFSGGLGIVLYIALWLVVPPATTASEKLQMQGKPVTLGALKDSVSKADVPTAARRAQSSVLPIINKLFGVVIKLIGIGFILAGLAAIFAVVATKVYMTLHHGQLFQENLFPVGSHEQWFLVTVMILVVIAALFLLLVGIASFKRAWPVRGWITSVLAGIFVVGLAVTVALAADIAPRVHQRYEESLHTTAVKDIQPFSSVTISGGVDIAYISSPAYAVNLHYADHPNLSKIKIYVKDKTLHIDSTAFDGSRDCTMLCLFPEYDMTVEVYAPNINNFDTPNSEIFYPPVPVAN